MVYLALLFIFNINIVNGDVPRATYGVYIFTTRFARTFHDFNNITQLDGDVLRASYFNIDIVHGDAPRATTYGVNIFTTRLLECLAT